MDYIPTLAVFGIVYGLIIFRNIRGVSVPIWASMCFGAIAVLATGSTRLDDSISAINVDVILFLLGMFVLVSGLESSGMLGHITNRILSYAKTPNQVLFFVICVMGVLSAFLINDTIALVATPIVIGLAKQMNVRPAPLLISLAFGVTLGSMMTPIGNPQNLLVSLHSGMEFPILTFLRYLILPTVASLFCTYYIVKKYYKKELAQATMPSITQSVVLDKSLAKKSSVLIIITVVGFFAIGITKMFGIQTGLNFAHVAILGGIVLLIIGNNRRRVVSGINWQILVFFAAMFVFVQGLADGGVIEVFQRLLPFDSSPDSPLSTINIIGTSVALSQLVSNVPFVAIYLPTLQDAGFTDTISWIALAAGSTIAGNLTILGAASTVIILEAAQKKNGTSFSFIEFFKIGSIVTATNVAILIFFLVLVR
ncbi:SLC13 family permease [Candidatus Nitrosotenuis aquarius]|uniref:SLC13 family permease n=1 Tax=Candidatus Nitrosotenuis aquarius TaxID=1846278 RepID=UPI000C1EEFB8|nr:SLC13 family permease [Candidatus Nitrosotenuis aquarius]